ncbi:unnamed protein product [Didymodactylos carnosus]|uniref:DED domain-containing protein n=1 Tax=Didymodactylos carnosus TaxID=1234261 RepID=A0A815UI40_9BILA|nr:unnamed protein product [Didymodactylos carnosus]CAF1534384.1 unnamed protein product [Didymodactylos carnosus]CAF4321760.1 unnamed protein product [Didymodactylos carnosus]
MDNDYELRKLLLNTEFALSDDDKDYLIFVIGSDIGKRLQNSKLIDVFEALIERNKISSNNLDYLIERLEAIKRLDVAQYLKEHKPSLSRVENNFSSPEMSLKDILSILRDEQSQESDSNLQDYLEDDSLDLRSLEISPSGLSSNLINTRELTDIDEVENTNITYENESSESSKLLQKIPDKYLLLINRALSQRNTVIDSDTYQSSGLISCRLTEYYYLKKVEEQSISNSLPCFLSFCLVLPNLSGQFGPLSYSPHLKLIEDDDNLKQELVYYIEKKYKKSAKTIGLKKANKLIRYLQTHRIKLNQIDLIIFNVCTRRRINNKSNEDEIQSYITLMNYLNDLHLSIDQKPRIIVIRTKPDQEVSVWDELICTYNQH